MTMAQVAGRQELNGAVAEITREALRQSIVRRIRYSLAQLPNATLNASSVAMALAEAVWEMLVDRMVACEQRYRATDVKRVAYLSMEFLIGRCLTDTLHNLGIVEVCREILAELNFDLDEVLDTEPDAGLGNGGLGRLAACFLESMATLDMPAIGYGIDYEYGLFRQQIAGGEQRERPDRWKDSSPILFIERLQQPYLIPIYGRVEYTHNQRDSGRCLWVDYRGVIGVPHDIPVAGFGGHAVSRLRLFSARSPEEFNLASLDQGDYIQAVEKRIPRENISRVLYPDDQVAAGKELRLLQEYFLVACAIRDIVHSLMLDGHSWDDLPLKIAIQMNDTHPSLAVAELMRMLVDGCELEWNHAWEVTQATLAYTNHTLLPEAIERWPLAMLQRVLPRHADIILQINQEFLNKVARSWPADMARLRRMSIVEEGSEKQVQMVHLAIVGSHAVNGVSKLHSQLLQRNLVPDFYEMWPERFSNKTNGVSPRVWLLEANPRLAALLTRTLGERWITEASVLRELETSIGDPGFESEFMEAKHQNKIRLSNLILRTTGIQVDPASLFDVHIKRIHEYKRQLLNVMRIIHEYLCLVEDRADVRVPRTYIFAGKAAPGYWAAKQIIRLIHNVADVINTDPRVAGRLKVVFLPDYRVSIAQVIIPAADLSEQISTAGTEASGTGNMKLAMNGALTIGTWDGANIEIRQEVGDDNIYMFGHTAEELALMRPCGAYHPRIIYNADPVVRRVVDALVSSRFCPDQSSPFEWIRAALLDHGDYYFHIADFPSYLQASCLAEEDFCYPSLWAKKALRNVARAGYFSSDRTVAEYAREIWHLESSATAQASAQIVG